jgi:hypothetical protein
MSRFACPVIVALAAILAALPPVESCEVAPVKGQPRSSVQTASEEAIIVYDEQTQTQHFIRTAQFSGSSAGFGFLVPTPAKPEIAEVDGSIYATLANVTKPRIEKRKKYVSEPPIGCGEMAPTKMAGEATPDMARVIEQKRVGDLDVAVLQAETPQAIRDWLGKNGYDDRPELTDWLKAYTREKWFVSAFKVAADAGSRPRTTTVKMSFRTPSAFYPYREAADTRAINPPGGRLLRLYVLANSISAGGIGMNPSKEWPAKTAWAGLLPIDRMAGIFAAMNVTTRPDEAWFLTEFEDRSSPRPGTDELYFGRAADQSPVERPPIVEYETINTFERDAGWVCLGAMGLAIAVVVVVRKRMRA